MNGNAAGTRNPERRTPNELAVRTYQQVADELAKRHGIHIGSARVQQIAMRAEAKLARALKSEWRERMGANSFSEVHG